MQPPPSRRPLPASVTRSVQYIGSRDPASSVDFHRRAQQQGLVDLTKDDTSTWKGSEFSTPQGKRLKLNHQTQNLSDYAMTLQSNWGEGTFRWVHKGMYTCNPRVQGHNGGPQNGELCVLKEFKAGSVYEETFFNDDIKAVSKAADFIQEFNKCQLGAVGSKPILLNKPQIWVDVYPDNTGRCRKKLVEPMLEGEFLKFNSNSGYTNGADFMQALSHFSYHHSNGRFLLCDLQGGHYEDAYVLTDPVIMSSGDTKTFGATDLGEEGIGNFFAHHKCNRFCKSHWSKPHRPTVSPRIPLTPSSTMSLTIGSGRSVADRKATLDAILASKRR